MDKYDTNIIYLGMISHDKTWTETGIKNFSFVHNSWVCLQKYNISYEDT